MLLEAANHVQRNGSLGCGMQIRGGFKFLLLARGQETRPHSLILSLGVKSYSLEERLNSSKRRMLCQEV